MGRVVLTEDEKKRIKDMYSDVKPSKKVMSYLKRNYQFFKVIDNMDFKNDEDRQKHIEEYPWIDKYVKIVIDDRSYMLNDDKKSIKNRILRDIEDNLLTIQKQKIDLERKLDEIFDKEIHCCNGIITKKAANNKNQTIHNT